MMAAVDTLAWPLAGITFCRTCRQPWQPYPAGRDRRFYLCGSCLDLHPAPPVENLVAAVAAERDWISTPHTSEPAATWTPARPPWTGVPLRYHLDRLVERITVAASDPVIEVWWRPVAVLPSHSPWLGPRTGPWASPSPPRGPPVPHQ